MKIFNEAHVNLDSDCGTFSEWNRQINIEKFIILVFKLEQNIFSVPAVIKIWNVCKVSS